MSRRKRYINFTSTHSVFTTCYQVATIKTTYLRLTKLSCVEVQRSVECNHSAIYKRFNKDDARDMLYMLLGYI